MDMQAIKEEVRLELTGDVVDFELSDTSLTNVGNFLFIDMTLCLI